MDRYPFGDESALHLEMHLPGFPESQGLLCSEDLNHDFCLNARDGLCLDVAPALPAADAGSRALEADLNALSLYPPKDCDSLPLLDEPDARPSQHGPGLPAPAGPEEAGGGAGGDGGSAGSGERALGSPGCSRCGEVLGSAGKRPDRLSGHTLTHQTVKPSACPERGCDESCCGHCSPRRHCELQHGSKGAVREEPPLHPAPSGPGSGKSGDRLTPSAESGSFPPERDPLRCVVNGCATRKLASARAGPAGAASTDPPPPSRPPSLPSHTLPDGTSQRRLSCRGTAAASPDLWAETNPGDVFAPAPGEKAAPDLTGGSFLSEAQLAAGPQRCPNSASPCLPVFQGQKPPASQASSNFQWARTVPAGAKPRRNSVCPALAPPGAAQGVSESLAGPSRTFSPAYECLDALPFPAAPFKAEEDAPSVSALGCFEEVFPSAEPPDARFWEELSFPEVGKRGGALRSETWQRFPEPPPLQHHLFQVMAKSQQVLAPAPLLPPEATDPLRAGFQQQPPPLAPHLPPPTEYEGLSPYPQKAVPQFWGVLPDGEKQGPQAAPLDEYVGLRDSAVPSQLRYAVPGSRPSGRPNRLENKPSASKKEKSKGRSAETGGKPPAGAGRSWRLPAARREKPSSGLGCGAPPSQVAMASCSSVAAGARRLTIFNRIQGGNIYSLTSAPKEANLAAGGGTSGAAPADGSGRASSFLPGSCGQPSRAERGPGSRLRGPSPPGKEEQQVRDAGDAGAREPSLEAEGDGSCPWNPEVPFGDATAAPLVIPVSVPVPAASSRAGSKVTAMASPGGKDLEETLHQKKRKRQHRPRSLFIPPPVAPDAPPGLGGCYQSNLRSPVFLVDHFLRHLFQCSPYTPPPMLSPVREGSGLYFSTLCSSPARGGANQLFSAVLGRTDRDFGFCVKGNTKIGVQPHINVGSRFQAEVPSLRERSHLEKDERAAALVWKPWGDIATNPRTQDRVTDLLNVACSSVMPGGGTNLELALHCLHEARGDVLEALEMLLFGGPQKSESHPLANYHYAGSDTWTPLEKQMFRKAFCVHKKDFYLIQKKIQTKNVSQCVEYYYIWKKKIKFDSSRAQVIEKEVKRDKDEVEKAEEKAVCSPRKRHHLLPKEGVRLKQRGYPKVPPSPAASPQQAGRADDRGVFPCRECERVFDKIKGRNAHMKSHRPQGRVEPLGKMKWPLKHWKSEAKAEEPQLLPAPPGSWETGLSE